ncbi:MAG: hypothetical protein ACREN3_01645 [Gemmatimonadaceae bacterium]
MFRQARWLAAAALLGSAATVKAQEFPLAPLIARLPGSTRALGMANADAGGRESDVIFYNPAQLAVARGTGASAEFYHQADLLVTLSTVLALGPGTVGVGVQSLTFSNTGVAYAAPDALDTSGSTPSSGLVFALGYAQPLFGMRAGINAKLLEQDIGSTNDNRGSLDFGLARDLLHGTLGLSLQNVGPAFRSTYGTVSQPTRTSLGFSTDRYLVGPFDVIAAATTSLVRGRDFIPGGGGEISYSWLDGYSIAARAGVRRAAEGEGPWTVGFGISADRLSLDYAYESRYHGHGAHRIGVRVR